MDRLDAMRVFVRVVETGTGRLLGTVDPGSADRTVHRGAVYLHQGTTYLVDSLDLSDSVALASAASPDYSTQGRACLINSCPFLSILNSHSMLRVVMGA